MIGQSELNVYIVGAEGLSPRLRQRLQAQIQSALRAFPQWVFLLLRGRLARLGLSHFPLIVELRLEGQGSSRALGLGRLEDKPAVQLRLVRRGQEVDWRQERRYLIAKAIAYLGAPSPEEEPGFWQRWWRALQEDRLAEAAAAVDERWAEASPLDLLLEMFAAYVLSPGHPRWQGWPAVRQFLDDWRGAAIDSPAGTFLR